MRSRPTCLPCMCLKLHAWTRPFGHMLGYNGLCCLGLQPRPVRAQTNSEPGRVQQVRLWYMRKRWNHLQARRQGQGRQHKATQSMPRLCRRRLKITAADSGTCADVRSPSNTTPHMPFRQQQRLNTASLLGAPCSHCLHLQQARSLVS